MSSAICKRINRMFKLPQHPFNMQNEGKMTYAQWQHAKGADTIKFYLEAASVEEIFEGKTVVDIGCGAAGKTLYYAGLGVKKIYGVEILEKYRAEAEALAQQTGNSDKFAFVCADAANMPFEDNSIDTIIANDAMEHVDDPPAVLKECLRILAKGGRLYLNFPPYYHPHGAHLSDAIGIPWVHVFFGDATLIKVYKDAVAHLPDGPARIEFRISRREGGGEYFSYINKMTVRKFRRMLRDMGIVPVYYREAPLRSFFIPLARLPIVKEMFVKMVVCVIEK